MLTGDVVKKEMNVDVVISTKMANAIELWSKMFTNEASWLTSDVESLELPSTIAGEFARLVTIEYKNEITGSARADYLNTQINTLRTELRKNVEFGCAMGGLVLKPYVSGDNILIDYVQADSFFPVGYDGRGKCTAGIFSTQKLVNGWYYNRIEYHQLLGTTYTVINKVFKSKNINELGKISNLQEVEDWKELDEITTIQGVDKPLFGYFKIPLANTIDKQSPLGVSVYSRAVKLIKQADRQFGRVIWEFEGSELAIDSDVTTLQMDSVNGKLGLPKLKDRLFRASGQGKDGASFYEVFSPAIRDVSLFNGFNKMLQRIEFNCGLAYGTISDPNSIEKTATEIKNSKQRSYSTVSDIQKALETAINDCIDAMDIIATLYKLAPNGTYEVSHEWDDSIIVDTEVEQTIRASEVTRGLSSKKKYLMWRYGLTEEQALKEIADIEAEKPPENNMFGA